MYSNILKAIYGSVWAATPEYVQAIMDFSNGFLLNTEALKTFRENAMEVEFPIEGATIEGRTGSGRVYRLKDGETVVMDIVGMIAPKSSAIGMCMAGTSMEMVRNQAKRLMADDSVKSVVLRIDSGGGSVLGVPEAADALVELGRVKNLVASIDMVAGSAAYWLASTASKRFITRSGIAGSIGVYAIVGNQAEKLEKEGIDVRILRAGKFKAMPNSIEAFTEDDPGLALVQDGVNRVYEEFVSTISTNLGITMSEAKQLANGTTSVGNDAIELGLADENGGLEDAIASVGGSDVLVASGDEDVEIIEVADADPIEVALADAEDHEAEQAAIEDKLALEDQYAETLAENVTLLNRVAELEKALDLKTKNEESEKITAVIATAIENGRIAPMKADEMAELGAEIGLDALVKMIEAIPAQEKMEDLSVAPELEDAEGTEANEDPYIPRTEEQKKLYRQVPSMARKYAEYL